MIISLIVALDQHGLIGRAGGLPWRLPADLAHFKAVTMGKPVIMGRRTCESLPKALPGRRNIVLTKNRDFVRDGFEVVHSPDELWPTLEGAEEAVVIGGAEIYRLLLPQTSRAFVTLVEGEFMGDTWFPEWPLTGWVEVASEIRPSDEKNPHGMTFMTMEKIGRSL